MAHKKHKTRKPKGHLKAERGDWHVILTHLDLDREFHPGDSYYHRAKRQGGGEIWFTDPATGATIWHADAYKVACVSQPRPARADDAPETPGD